MHSEISRPNNPFQPSHISSKALSFYRLGYYKHKPIKVSVLGLTANVG